MSRNSHQPLHQSTGKVTELRSVPEPYNNQIRKIVGRVYGSDKLQSNASAATLMRHDIDDIVRDINNEIERVNAALNGSAWSEAYNVLVTIRDVVQNLSAAASMRRASQSQYDTAWPGTRWR